MDSSRAPSQLWGGETYAEPAPILVQYPNGGPEKMFVFHTGKNGNIYFTRLNGTVWEDGKWIKIVDPATGGIPTTKMDGWEVAPAYNPETHRLYVYYAKDYNDYLHYAYSDDFGTTWHAPGLAPNSPIIKAAPSAIFYKPAGGTTDVLLAMKDVNQKIRLCTFAGGTFVSSEVLATPSTDNINGYGRPFLTDVGTGKIALMYGAEHGDQTYCSDYFIPHIVVMDRATGQWGTPYQATTLPDLGVAQGEYQFYWQPNGALDPTTNTFWLFYGFELCAMYTDETNNGPWWMFTSIATPGATAGVTRAWARPRRPATARCAPSEPFSFFRTIAPGCDGTGDGVRRLVRALRAGKGRVDGAGDTALRGVLPAGVKEGGGGRRRWWRRDTTEIANHERDRSGPPATDGYADDDRSDTTRDRANDRPEGRPALDAFAVRETEDGTDAH